MASGYRTVNWMCAAATIVFAYTIVTALSQVTSLSPDGKSIVIPATLRARLLFQHQGKLYLIDSRSKKVRELLSVAPNEFGNGVTRSRDDRQIYFSLVTTEADIWLMNLE